MSKYVSSGGFMVMVALVALFSLACVKTPQGPHVHYARATPQDLASVENQATVWYEFKVGDQVPMSFVFIGMAEMAANNLRMVVKRHFFIVRHNDRQFFSFDGRTLVQNPFSRWGMVIGRGQDRGNAAVMMYVGPANEAPRDLL